MRCVHCGTEEEPVFIHGKHICPRCKQIPPSGECCQGDQIKDKKECKDEKEE
tara:strand:- start:70 stop:225 length:156 start_codon:yes stop_codon:yes gene_type:complete